MAEARIDSEMEDKTLQSEEDILDTSEIETLPAQEEPLIQTRPAGSSSFVEDHPLNTSRGAKVRRSVSKSLSKMGRVFGQCRCDKPSCSVCGSRKMRSYEKLMNEDYYRIPVIQGSVTIKFYNEDPPNTEYRTLVVTEQMTAFDVCKALCKKYHIPDYMDYAVIEYWTEYCAWRRLEDSELVLQEYQAQVMAPQGHDFFFICRTDYDKPDWVKAKFGMFYHPKEVRFLMDKEPIINRTKPSPERILLRGTFFHTEKVGVNPNLAKAKAMQEKLEKPAEEGEFDDFAVLSSPSKVKPLSPDEKIQFKELLRAHSPSSPLGGMSKATSKESTSAESPVTYAEIQPVLGKSPTSSLAGTSKRSDNDDDAKPSTSTLQYAEIVFKESTSAGKLESMPSTSKTSDAEKQAKLDLINRSKTVSKSISLTNIGMSSKPLLSPTTTKVALETIDEKNIDKKTRSLGNLEHKLELIDDSKDLLTTPGASSPSDEYPDPYKGVVTRWRIPSAVTRALDLTREDDKDYAYDPVYCGEVLVRKGVDQLTIPLAKELRHKAKDTKWTTKYLLLRNKNLYFVSDKKTMYNCYLMSHSEFLEEHCAMNNKPYKKGDPLKLIGHVSRFRAYSSTQCRLYFAPGKRAIICLRDLSDRTNPLRLMFLANYLLDDIGAPSRLQWLTALKFAQFGKQVLLNFFRHRHLKNAYSRSIGVAPEDFLAMDFHDGVGRVIFEEREIAEVQKKSRHEPRLKQVLDEDPEIFKQGAHMTQKYYHKNLSRGAACDILNKHKKEGMWLLRDSESRKGTMSVDYYFIKVRHMQIKVATYNDEYTNSKILVVTTDLNQAFYDVHSLLEFYKLNMGPNLDTNFRCLLGQCVENAEQRDASPIRLPFTTKMHTNVVVKHGQASGSGLLAKLGSKIMRKESVKK